MTVQNIMNPVTARRKRMTGQISILLKSHVEIKKIAIFSPRYAFH